MIKKVYSTRTTYAPNGEQFTEPTPPLLTMWDSIQEAMGIMWRCYGFQPATETQVVRSCPLGFMDVVTYSEEMEQ